MSRAGSYSTTVASRCRPATSTRGRVTPATTCALVMIRSGAYTKPEPSTRRAQDTASPVILTTEGWLARTALDRSNVGSGAGTSRTRVGTSGPNTSGKSYARSEEHTSELQSRQYLV